MTNRSKTGPGSAAKAVAVRPRCGAAEGAGAGWSWGVPGGRGWGRFGGDSPPSPYPEPAGGATTPLPGPLPPGEREEEMRIRRSFAGRTRRRSVAAALRSRKAAAGIARGRPGSPGCSARTGRWCVFRARRARASSTALWARSWFAGPEGERGVLELGVCRARGSGQACGPPRPFDPGGQGPAARDQAGAGQEQGSPDGLNHDVPTPFGTTLAGGASSRAGEDRDRLLMKPESHLIRP